MKDCWSEHREHLEEYASNVKHSSVMVEQAVIERAISISEKEETLDEAQPD